MQTTRGTLQGSMLPLAGRLALPKDPTEVDHRGCGYNLRATCRQTDEVDALAWPMEMTTAAGATVADDTD